MLNLHRETAEGQHPDMVKIRSLAQGRRLSTAYAYSIFWLSFAMGSCLKIYEWIDGVQVLSLGMGKFGRGRRDWHVLSFGCL